MKRTIAKSTLMATVAVSMLTASCSTQKKAQSDAAAFGESAVASRPAPGHNIDEQYLVLSEAQQQLIDKTLKVMQILVIIS